ncbi:MAG: hypothetical protein JSV03_17205 [Planctomycetota bacterium]|nr:MAG: hypothetical protein JSV03_17205 [Planctomycetota bacterium]
MRMIQRVLLCCLAVMLLFAATGCPSLDPRTSNQGGGSLLTIFGKVGDNGVIGDLNPDEWQILTDNLPSFAAALGIEIPSDVTIPQLTDEQAQDFVNLLDENNINTIEELQAAIDDGTITVPESLQGSFS